MPDYKLLTLSNPSQEKPIDWRLDTSSLETYGVFTVVPQHGVIDPQKTVQLRVCFLPLKA